MSRLLIDLDDANVYFYDILVLGFGSIEDHFLTLQGFYLHNKSQSSSEHCKEQNSSH